MIQRVKRNAATIKMPSRNCCSSPELRTTKFEFGVKQPSLQDMKIFAVARPEYERRHLEKAENLFETGESPIFTVF